MQPAISFPLAARLVRGLTQTDLPRCDVDDAAFATLQDYLWSLVGVCLPADFPRAWCIQTTVATDPYRATGTFPRRVAKWLRHRHGIDLTVAATGRVGQIACSQTARRIWWDCVGGELGWRAGSYGDSSSCLWWPCAYGASTLRKMGREGFIVVRTYAAPGIGNGRAWCRPVGECFVLWGSFGHPLVTFATLVGVALGWRFARTENVAPTEELHRRFFTHDLRCHELYIVYPRDDACPRLKCIACGTPLPTAAAVQAHRHRSPERARLAAMGAAHRFGLADGVESDFPAVGSTNGAVNDPGAA